MDIFVPDLRRLIIAITIIDSEKNLGKQMTKVIVILS